MRKAIYTYKQKRNLSHYIDQAIDSKIVDRLYKLSAKHLRSRRSTMAIFANEYVGILINQFGVYDKFALDSLFSFLGPVLGEMKTSSALDIGANIGNHTIYFSDYFSSVYSFEPNPQTFDLLSFNLKTVDNCFPFNVGLGDAAGIFELYENKGNMGASSIKHDYDVGSGRVKIQVKKLDDIEAELGNVSFIKLDVEGFEYNVIRGGLSLIRRHRPIIVLEQTESSFVDGSTESIDLLKENGYRFCWCQAALFDRSWIVRRLGTIGTILFGTSYDFNFTTDDAVPKGNYETLIAVPARFQERLGFPKSV
jgi:FkbM family methyltransferase